MKTFVYFPIILLSVLMLNLQSCAVAESSEGGGEFDTEKDTTETETDTSHDSPTDSENPPSSDSESTPDSLTDETDSITESETETETETETFPEEDTEWMADTDIIHFWSFNGSDGDFTSSIISGYNDPWEWGVPDPDESVGYPGNADGRAWGTNMIGTHGTCEIAALTSKEFDLSTYGGKTLTISWNHSIYYYYNSSVYQAGITVEVFDGDKWVTPPTAPSCEADGCACTTGWTASSFSMSCSGSPLYLDGKPGFGSNSCAWEKRTVTISQGTYPSNFKFRFVHGAGSEQTKPGAYIDNVELRMQ